MLARETWESRTTFVLAAVGAAVGFGNVWRFPALVYKFGGGAFFLPYVLALVIIGIPLLIHEIAMGQHLQKSEIGVQHHLNKHTKGVGVGSILAGMMVATYYVPLISWCIRAFLESFGSMREDWEDVSGSDATTYFYHNVIGQYTLDEDQKPTRIVIANVFYLALTWGIVGCCLSFGLKWTGRVAYVTMGMPILMLFILLIRALTLPGSSKGIHQYFSEWDMSVLVNQPDVWSEAVSQIFFSIGVAFGVMTAFGSHCDKNAPAVENSCIIAVANSTFSILSGGCLFGFMGYMTEQENNFRVYAGPSLLFGVYPAALSTIPGGIHWVRFFFLNMILLGLDSAFALVEAVASLVSDSQYGHTVSKPMVVAGVCGIGFFGGLLYTTDAGLLFLDTMDFYVNFAVLFLGFCKALSAGWFYGMKRQVKNIGDRWNIAYAYFGSTFGSCLFASLVWFGVKGETFWLGLISLIVIYGSGVVYCLHNLKELVNEDKSVSMKFLRNELLMGNVLELRDELASSVGYLPWSWAFLMKHAIPQILLVLFFNLFFAQTDYGNIEFGSYNSYETMPYQVLGVISTLLIFGAVLVGVLHSKVFDFLISDEDVNSDNKAWVDVEMKDQATNNAEQQQPSTEYSNMDDLETPKQAAEAAAAAAAEGAVLT
mmetsp:Transcript_20522/g.44660  ORF Transcript_20522/g.44660 Transcript_20522/m.44660 type:complete len:654 (-) Transcript_20522:252-2213(-)